MSDKILRCEKSVVSASDRTGHGWPAQEIVISVEGLIGRKCLIAAMIFSNFFVTGWLSNQLRLNTSSVKFDCNFLPRVII